MRGGRDRAGRLARGGLRAPGLALGGRVPRRRRRAARHRGRRRRAVRARPLRRRPDRRRRGRGRRPPGVGRHRLPDSAAAPGSRRSSPAVVLRARPARPPRADERLDGCAAGGSGSPPGTPATACACGSTGPVSALTSEGAHAARRAPRGRSRPRPTRTRARRRSSAPMWVSCGTRGALAPDVVDLAPRPRRAATTARRSRSRRRRSGARGWAALAPAVDGPAGDRAARRRVVVGRDGPDEVAVAVERVARAIRLVALERAPAQVLRRLVELEQDAVDLLDLVLADVADPDLAQRRVEPEAPGVAQPGEHDLPVAACAPSTRVAISLPSSDCGSWAWRSGSNAPPPSPRPRYRRPSGPNASWPPLWFSSGWSTNSSSPQRRGIDGAVPAGAELGDARVARAVRPVQVQAPVGREVGVEGDAEQPLLGAREDLGRRGRAACAGGSPSMRTTRPGCSSTHSAPSVAGRRADPRRAVEAAGDALDVEVVRRGRASVRRLPGASGCRARRRRRARASRPPRARAGQPPRLRGRGGGAASGAAS